LAAGDKELSELSPKLAYLDVLLLEEVYDPFGCAQVLRRLFDLRLTVPFFNQTLYILKRLGVCGNNCVNQHPSNGIYKIILPEVMSDFPNILCKCTSAQFVFAAAAAPLMVASGSRFGCG
jgi:hypothetical protein